MAKRTPRRRRISARYRDHLADIARLFVQHHGVKRHTADAVRKLRGCEGFRADYLRTWLRDPEFAALVKTEEERQKQETQLAPDVRGPEKLAWLVAVEQELRRQFDQAKSGGKKGDPDEKLAREILTVCHKHGAEVRAEEKHLAEQQDSAARRSFAGLLRNLVRFVRARHARTAGVVLPVLEDALKNLKALQEGKYDA